jgi:serine/threonine protein kinase
MNHLTQFPILRDVPTLNGFKVLDRIVLYSLLGQGGMGAVFLGCRLRLETDVAVKCLVPRITGLTDVQVQRFWREARLAASIHSPNLIKVSDLGEAYGLHYMVMEFVDGESLQEWIERRGALPPDEALTIVLGAAQGLAAAHRHGKSGVTHRDIKPANIMIARNGEVKVADLGIASAESEPQVTVAGAVFGTPQFMPAEQFAGAAQATPASDVYAMGVTLAYMLTGQKPLEGKSIPEIIRAADRGFSIEPVRASCPVQPVLELIERATQTKPKDRYANGTELSAAVAKVLNELGGPVDLSALAAEGRRTKTVSTPPTKVELDSIASRLHLGASQQVMPRTEDDLSEAVAAAEPSMTVQQTVAKAPMQPLPPSPERPELAGQIPSAHSRSAAAAAAPARMSKGTLLAGVTLLLLATGAIGAWQAGLFGLQVHTVDPGLELAEAGRRGDWVAFSRALTNPPQETASVVLQGLVDDHLKALASLDKGDRDDLILKLMALRDTGVASAVVALDALAKLEVAPPNNGTQAETDEEDSDDPLALITAAAHEGDWLEALRRVRALSAPDKNRVAPFLASSASPIVRALVSLKGAELHEAREILEALVKESLLAEAMLTEFDQLKLAQPAGPPEPRQPLEDERKADGNDPSKTPVGVDADLETALRKGDLAGVRAALEAGAKPEVVRINGFPGLCFAVELEDPAIAAVLLEHGANAVVVCGEGGRSLMHLAVENENVAMIKILRQHGVRVDSRTERGQTPLHYAAMRNRVDLLDALTTELKGSDRRLLETANIDGYIPLHLVKHGATCRRLLELHEEWKVKIDVPSKSGATPLYYVAAITGSVEALKPLVDAYRKANIQLTPSQIGELRSIDDEAINAELLPLFE